MQKENWKDIGIIDDIDYTRLYQVSSMGLVKSLNYRHTGREEILKPSMNTWGYLFVSLWKNGERNYTSIGRLVAIAFDLPIPEHLKHLPLEQLEVDHIDTDKTNNAVWNLRWTDSKGNSNNPLTRQHMSEAHKGMKHTETTKCKISESHRGMKHTEETKSKMSKSHKGVFNIKTSKPVLQLDKDTGEVIREWPSAREVQRQLGYAQASICNCCNGKLNQAYGYKWKYT